MCTALVKSRITNRLGPAAATCHHRCSVLGPGVLTARGGGRAPFIARAVSAPGTTPLSGGGYATIPIYCVDT